MILVTAVFPTVGFHLPAVQLALSSCPSTLSLVAATVSASHGDQLSGDRGIHPTSSVGKC